VNLQEKWSSWVDRRLTSSRRRVSCAYKWTWRRRRIVTTKITLSVSVGRISNCRWRRSIHSHSLIIVDITTRSTTASCVRRRTLFICCRFLVKVMIFLLIHWSAPQGLYNNSCFIHISTVKTLRIIYRDIGKYRSLCDLIISNVLIFLLIESFADDENRDNTQT